MLSGAECGEELEAVLDQLETMSLRDLRSFWLERWGYAPRLRSVVLMRHLIAWRLQAAAYGGFDRNTARLISSRDRCDGAALNPGAKLVREYLGVLHTVDVTGDGFSYAGKSFRSLTGVAQEITGTHWNGPHFFGLRSGREVRA